MCYIVCKLFTFVVSGIATTAFLKLKSILLKAYLYTALCVWSLSSPLMVHEKSPKDSVPTWETEKFCLSSLFGAFWF